MGVRELRQAAGVDEKEHPSKKSSALVSTPTPEELEVLTSLAESFKKFSKLPDYHPMDAQEFAQIIHAGQNMILARAGQRSNPQAFILSPQPQPDASEAPLSDEDGECRHPTVLHVETFKGESLICDVCGKTVE
tara:strand:+ start:4340 stop:4741 length:402 start_codon:yes stop_codon:yes gene_type:complete